MNFLIFLYKYNIQLIIVLVNGLSDINMANGFDYNKIIKIGFLNDNVDKKIGFFKKL